MMVLNGMLHHDDVAGFQLSRVLFLWRTISGVRVENLVFRRVSPSEIGILTKQRKQKPNKHHWFSHTYTLCNNFFLLNLYGSVHYMEKERLTSTHIRIPVGFSYQKFIP